VASTLLNETQPAPDSGWLLREVLADPARRPASPPPSAAAPAQGPTDSAIRQGAVPFFPPKPTTFEALDLRTRDVEALMLRLLLQRNGQSGSGISDALRIPHRLLEPLVKNLREQRLLEIRQSVGSHDYEYVLTDKGLQQARQEASRTAYCEAAPVSYRDYVRSVELQSPTRAKLTIDSLKRALGDLSIEPALLSRLGRAITGGRAMFLCGPPGNGKTSIAERMVRSYTDSIWIPYAISFAGEIVRLYDPLVHQAVPTDGAMSSQADDRWIRIRRPAVIAGGELDLDATFFRIDQQTKLLQPPIHLKSNGGVLIIDDFGRQRMRPNDLLNRWIVPLESRVDYLPLPSGRSFRVPFEQFLVLSTNLRPMELIDEAYLRRIPYKIEVAGPSPEEFVRRLWISAEQLQLTFQHERVIPRLLEIHFARANRPIRFCHARDLLVLVQHQCEFLGLPSVITDELLDEAVATYFFEEGV
jgi:hypothetical protein